MASNKDIEIKIQAAVESAEAAKSLGALKKSLLEIQTLQAELGDTSGANFDKLSQAATSASSKLAETRDKIGDIQDKTRTLEGTPVERLTGSFGLLKESIMNLDFDKAKIGAEGLLNTFTPMVDGKLVTGVAGIKGAFSMLGDGVKSLGSTFMSVGKALLTNPIFLLAAAIVAIVAVVIIIMDKLGILKKVMDALMIPINLIIEGFKMLTDWLGLTTYALEDNAAAAKANGEAARSEIDATANKQKGYATLVDGMTADEIANFQKKAGIKDNLNKNSFDIEKDRLTQTQDTLKAEIDALNELQEAGGELTEDQQKDLEQRKKDYEANAASIQQIEAQKNKAIIDLNKKSSDTLRDWKIKNILDENKRAKAQLEISEGEAIREIDVQIQKTKSLGLSYAEEKKIIKDLTDSKVEIHKYFVTQTKKIDSAIAKDNAEKAKTEYDNYVDGINKKIKAQEDASKLAIAQTKEGSEERVKAEKDAIDKMLALQHQYSKELKLSKDQLGLLDIQAKDKKEQLDNDYTMKAVKLSQDEVKAANEAAVQKAVGLDETYKAKRQQLLDNAKFELDNEELVGSQRELVSAKYYATIQALDNEYTEKKKADTALKLETDISAAQYDLDNLQVTSDKKFEMESAAATKLKDAQIAQIDADRLELLSATDLTENEKAKIEEDYRQKKGDAERALTDKIKLLKQEERAATIENFQKGVQATQALSDAFFAVKKRNLTKGSEEEKKAAKQQFAVNKALQLGMAVIDGFKAVTSSLAQAPIAIGPIPNPAGIASLVFAVATSAANIVKIAASKFESPASPATTPATPDTGGGGGDGGGGSPTTFTPTQFFGLGQTTANGMGGGTPPVKVYVTEGDISGVQQKVKVIEQRAIY
jgi:hypothetical protein